VTNTSQGRYLPASLLIFLYAESEKGGRGGIFAMWTQQTLVLVARQQKRMIKKKRKQGKLKPNFVAELRKYPQQFHNNI